MKMPVSGRGKQTTLGKPQGFSTFNPYMVITLDHYEEMLYVSHERPHPKAVPWQCTSEDEFPFLDV